VRKETVYAPEAVRDGLLDRLRKSKARARDAWHGWKVNLGNGAVERPAAATQCVRTFPTRVDGGIVSVELPDSFTIV
jgi:nitrite reductase/ring-hydroxylating ferredoxin subunit